MVFLAKSQCSSSWILCHVFKGRKGNITLLWEGVQDIRKQAGMCAFVGRAREGEWPWRSA